VHGAELTRLAREAGEADARGALADAASAWRSALELLPPEAGQAAQIRARLETLSRRIEQHGPGGAAGTPQSDGGASRGRLGAQLGIVASAALLLWKFKALILLALGKGKLFFAGLTKLPTLLSMAASVGVYWTVWGWRFALGLVASIYVHEMGHVFALRRYGIAASAPMFIPGIGAFIRSKQVPATPRENARIGLAGPLFGLFATLATYAAHLATGWEILAAIAKVGAWVNLFNLLPLGTLDGGRGFASFTRLQRGVAAAVIALCWASTGDGLLVILGLCAAGRTFIGRAPSEPDWPALAQYAFLCAALSAGMLIPVSGIP
jgi:Zn-dependent protease